jgi:phage regulator Rha-like protein
MNAIVKFSAAVSLTMSSQEIADLVNSRHDKVKQSIERLVERGVIVQPPMGEVENKQSLSPNKWAKVYHLCKRDSLIVVAQLCPEFTAVIVDRWQELEEQLSAPALPKSLPEALRLAADLAEQKALAEQQRDEAIATKALIGSKREATAMATAAAAKREAHKLEVELDRSMMYASVKRVEREHPGQKFNWRILKRKCEEIGIPSIDVFDQNYGSVKSYHAEVWRNAYSIDICSAKGSAHA